MGESWGQRRGLCPRLCRDTQDVVIPFCSAAPVIRVSQYHFAHQVTNRGQFFDAHGTRRQDFESKFSKKISGVIIPDPLYGTGLPHHAHITSTACVGSKHPVLGSDHRVPLKVMVPHSVPILLERDSFSLSQSRSCDRPPKRSVVRQPGLELSGGWGVEPPVHVYRRSFLSENWL